MGLCECARNWACLNTVKRYANITDVNLLIRPPQYRSCAVDPYRDHLRQRRAAGPVPTTTLLAEIQAMGYPGSYNLLDRYLHQGRAELELADPSIRRLTCWILADPAHLSDTHRAHRDKLTAMCPEMAALAAHVAAFAQLITTPGGDLQAWIDTVTADDLPALHSFIVGLDKDRPAVEAGLRLAYSNGPTEGVNTKIKLLKRQTTVGPGRTATSTYPAH